MAFNNVSDTYFHFSSEPNFFDISNMPIKSYEKIYLLSDMIEFFAYAEVFWRDKVGIIADKINFLEGLPMKIEIGYNDDENYLKNWYVWSEHQIVKTELGQHISGVNLFTLLSYEYIDTVKQSRAFKDKTISEVIEQIMKEDYEFPTEMTFITKTEAKDTWYQLNETNREFIRRLSYMAYSSQFEKGSFATFFNNSGEFYFINLEDIFKKKEIIDTYFLELNETTIFNPKAIKSFDIISAGLPTNYRKYNVKAYHVDDTGTYYSTDAKLKDKLIKSKDERLLILEENTKVNTEFRSFGITESETDKDIVKGKINDLFFNNHIAYQMKVKIVFNPKIDTGKLIEIKIESAFEDKQIAAEYSGLWLIVRCEIYFHIQSGQIFMDLHLCKSGLNVDSDHKLKDKLIPAE